MTSAQAGHFDVALGDQPPNQHVGQAEGDAKLARKRALAERASRGDSRENLTIILVVGRAHETLRASRSQRRAALKGVGVTDRSLRERSSRPRWYGHCQAGWTARQDAESPGKTRAARQSL